MVTLSSCLRFLPFFQVFAKPFAFAGQVGFFSSGFFSFRCLPARYSFLAYIFSTCQGLRSYTYFLIVLLLSFVWRESSQVFILAIFTEKVSFSAYSLIHILISLLPFLPAPSLVSGTCCQKSFHISPCLLFVFSPPLPGWQVWYTSYACLSFSVHFAVWLHAFCFFLAYGTYSFRLQAVFSFHYLQQPEPYRFSCPFGFSPLRSLQLLRLPDGFVILSLSWLFAWRRSLSGWGIKVLRVSSLPSAAHALIFFIRHALHIFHSYSSVSFFHLPLLSSHIFTGFFIHSPYWYFTGLHYHSCLSFCFHFLLFLCSLSLLLYFAHIYTYFMLIVFFIVIIRLLHLLLSLLHSDCQFSSTLSSFFFHIFHRYLLRCYFRFFSSVILFQVFRGSSLFFISHWLFIFHRSFHSHSCFIVLSRHQCLRHFLLRYSKAFCCLHASTVLHFLHIFLSFACAVLFLVIYIIFAIDIYFRLPVSFIAFTVRHMSAFSSIYILFLIFCLSVCFLSAFSHGYLHSWLFFIHSCLPPHIGFSSLFFCLFSPQFILSFFILHLPYFIFRYVLIYYILFVIHFSITCHYYIVFILFASLSLIESLFMSTDIIFSVFMFNVFVYCFSVWLTESSCLSFPSGLLSVLQPCPPGPPSWAHSHFLLLIVIE